MGTPVEVLFVLLQAPLGNCLDISLSLALPCTRPSDSVSNLYKVITRASLSSC